MSNFIIAFRKTWIFILKIAMFLSLIVSFFVVWGTIYTDTLFYYKGNYLLLLIYYLLLVIFYKVYGAGLIDGQNVYNIFVSWFFTLITTNFFAYVVISLIDSKLIKLSGMFILFFVQLLISFLYSLMLKNLYSLLYPIKDVMLIYGEEVSESIILKIMTKKSKYKLISVKSQNDDFENMKKTIDKVDGIFLYCVKGHMADNLIDYCYGKGKRTYIIPTSSDIILRNSTITQVSDLSVMICKNRGITIEQCIIKRFFDIVLSFIGLICLSPIIIVVSILIKLYDNGPVFFVQPRVTKNDKIFNLYKFRSMIIDAEKDGKARLATKNDSRITPIGKFIRATRIDEIPQLINVFKGDMTIVGPRPERPEIIEEYVKKYPDFRFRTKVKSGMTGYAQIYGKYNTTPIDKLHLDLIYIEQYSFLLDLKLIFLTLKIMFLPESTEGISDGQVSAMKDDDKISN